MNDLTNILQWLSDFEDKDARDQYLESKGYDVDKAGERGVNFIKKQLAEAKFREARKKKDLLAKAKEMADQNDIDVKNFLNNSGQTHNFAYQFSKHEDITKEDALEMLTDQQLLQVIEQLKDQNDE